VIAVASVATAPRERGWRWFVLALVVVVVVTMAPSWPPALALLAAVVRLVLPFEQLALLVLVCFAACAVVGWWAGGRLTTALLSIGVAAWMLFKVPMPADGYGGFVRGWSVALAAGFGLVCLASGNRTFLGRAIAAVAFAFVVWETGVALSDSATSVFSNSVQMLDGDYQRRLGESLDLWKSRTQSGAWQAFASRVPQLASRADGVAERFQDWSRDSELRSRSWLVLLAPALLALESVLALAIAWTSYHRLTRTRIGPPLGALRTLRFSDQLIWGLVLGATIIIVPSLATWRDAGVNLLCFFGSLYALRGAGVLSVLVPDRVAVVLLLALVLLVSVLGAGPVLMTILVVSLGAGLTDTWRDFRATAKKS
jgi:hypothetical protein